MERTDRVRLWFTNMNVRRLRYALIGGLVLLAVDAALNVRDLKAPGLLPYLATAFVGCTVGWLYDLGVSMSAQTQKSIAEMRRLSHLLEIQEPPVQMLVNAGDRFPTIRILLNESVGKQYRTIAPVNPNKYLSLLKHAVSNSDCFNGVMRNTVSWFQQTSEGTSYLKQLADRRMREKTRIFIIDDAMVQRMRDELAEPELMAFYWRNTGQVDTYWIAERDFRQNYGELTLPEDFALFDSKLLIRYDEQRQIIFFDLVEERSPERRIFDELKAQLDNKTNSPFLRIPRGAGSAVGAPSGPGLLGRGSALPAE